MLDQMRQAVINLCQMQSLHHIKTYKTDRLWGTDGMKLTKKAVVFLMGYYGFLVATTTLKHLPLQWWEMTLFGSGVPALIYVIYWLSGWLTK